MPSVIALLLGSVIGCVIGGMLGYLGYRVGRAVESRMWLLAEVIWLRKTPPGEALEALYLNRIAHAEQARVWQLELLGAPR